MRKCLWQHQTASLQVVSLTNTCTNKHETTFCVKCKSKRTVLHIESSKKLRLNLRKWEEFKRTMLKRKNKTPPFKTNLLPHIDRNNRINSIVFDVKQGTWGIVLRIKNPKILFGFQESRAVLEENRWAWETTDVQTGSTNQYDHKQKWIYIQREAQIPADSAAYR